MIIESISGLTVNEDHLYTIIEGITEGEYTLTKSGGTTVKAYVVLVKAGASAKFVATVPNYYTSGSTATSRVTLASNWTDASWGRLGVTSLVNQYQSASDTSNVLVGINGDFTVSDKPRGSVILEGNAELVPSTAVSDEWFFGCMEDGSLDICQRTSSYKNNYIDAICGGSLILNNWSVNTTDSSEARARTGVAIKGNGDTLLITTSEGITVLQLAQIMRASGCYIGINMDGGGSTTLVTRRSGESQTTRRTPAVSSSDPNIDTNNERTVTTALLLVVDNGPVNTAGAPETSITYTNTSTETWGVTIQSNKSSYKRGENIYVKTSGILSISSSVPWIGIYNADPTPTKDTPSKCWAWPWNGTRYVDVSDFIINNDSNIQDPNMAVTINSPLIAGDYWIVVFGNDGKWAHVEITIEGKDTSGLEVFASLNSSNGQLRIFRDTENKYTNGQTSGTLKYYAGLEAITKNTSPLWEVDKANIRTVVLEGNFRPATAYRLFANCINLTSITGISYLDTQDVANFSATFQNCSSLTSLDLSSLNTNYAQTMEYMFSDCSALTSLNVSGFNTSKVTRMMYMFKGCSKLTSLNITSFDTHLVTTMSNMFSGCSKLTSLNISNMNTAKVTSMKYMFNNCSSLTSLTFPSSFRSGYLKDLSYIFNGCSGLTSLDLRYFSTTAVTDMSSMFRGCSSLANLNLSSFSTNNVITMNSMFRGCRALTTLDVSDFDTQKVTDMGAMFYGLKLVNNLDLSNFKTPKLTNTGLMFTECSALTTLDLHKMTTKLVTNMKQMFYNCNHLKTIYVSPYLWDVNAVTDDTQMFYKCTALIGEKGTIYDVNQITKTYAHVDEGNSNPGYLTTGADDVYAAVTDDAVNPIILRIFKDAYGKYKNGVDTGDTVYYNEIEEWNSWQPKWYDRLYDIEQIIIEDSFTPLTLSYYFCGAENAVSIVGLNKINTSKVTSMEYMFAWCASLTSLDLSNFNTSNVTDMDHMFTYCSNLISLDLSNFNTTKVTNMAYMFAYCSNLTSLDLSNFKIKNGLQASCMFDNNTNLSTIYVSGLWNNNFITYSIDMFKNCTALVGEKGTVYNNSYVDKTYAIIDNAPTNPGYLTYKSTIPVYNIFAKINGAWVLAIPKVKYQNQWVDISKIYTKLNDSWTEL